MTPRRLHDERPSRQERECADLGVDNLHDDREPAEDIAWGSDPFDILAHRESLGLFDEEH